MHAADLAQRYPRVKVDPASSTSTPDVLTSAGTAAGIDLCLHVVRHDHGAEVANAVARRAAMSPRTFARRFRATTGTTPHRWILRQRLLLAQRLLETTEEPIGWVAGRCGFASAAGLRMHFSRELGASPLAYRNAFRGGNGPCPASPGHA
jgi:transcriptional regulator GlxA family with amidase domain